MISFEFLRIIVILLIVFVVVQSVLMIVMWRKTKKMQDKLDILSSGKDAKSLEGTILKLVSDVESLDSEIQELFGISNKIYKLAKSGINKFDIIRFDPFKDSSGNQSFVVAMLNGHNDGVIISSLHTRGGNRVYGKKIINGKSAKHILTDEENRLLEKVISVSKKK